MYQVKSGIRTTTGARKNQQDDLKAVNDKPLFLVIWCRQQRNGNVCNFDDMDEYISMSKSIQEHVANVFISELFRCTAEKI